VTELLSGIATAIRARQHRPAASLRFEVEIDTTTGTFDVTASAGITRAALRDMCLQIAAACNNTLPSITITRDGKPLYI
jgi:hypothetical protein